MTTELPVIRLTLLCENSSDCWQIRYRHAFSNITPLHCTAIWKHGYMQLCSCGCVRTAQTAGRYATGIASATSLHCIVLHCENSGNKATCNTDHAAVREQLRLLADTLQAYLLQHHSTASYRILDARLHATLSVWLCENSSDC